MTTAVEPVADTGPGTSLLTGIGCPEDLRRLPTKDLPRLAAEIRAELVDKVRASGGHLGPNLGVVELTVALHRVFSSPRDALVWDTGHQTYVHKMLTGRVDGFDSLRQRGGLSGYPSREESVHDVVENSHASTSLAYADGLAKAFELTGQVDRRVVAVVGDGALTGGMCWEALNNLGAAPQRPVIVVLNDNGRSYAPTVGQVPVHLRELRENCNNTASGNLFESVGLTYVGPVDGHDVAATEKALRTAAMLHRPVLVHVVTRKGEGYRPAEEHEADRMHTISAHSSSPGSVTGVEWTATFGEELVILADERPDLVAITAAMLDPTGLSPFAQRYPDRVFDVGIAEQHAVASAAGLAAAGMHPVVAIYSTFLNRAFDQVLMDAALHRAAVTFVLDRAGLTGPDGPSHHGMWDVSLLSLVPGMRLAAPRDLTRLRALLRACVAYDGPSAIRFPRGKCAVELPALESWGSSAEPIAGSGHEDVVLLPVGPLAQAAIAAAQLLAERGIEVDVVDPVWVLPIDPELVRRLSGRRLVVTIEDNAPSGGFGDNLARALGRCHNGDQVPPRVCALGLPVAGYVEAGERAELHHRYGLDAEGIAKAVESACNI